MLWLYLHFPYLLLEHFSQSEPAPHPMALISGKPAKVLQANPPAASQGVAPGQTMQTAAALAPDLRLIPADLNEQQRILRQQAVWLYRHVARITLYAPDGILTEAGSLCRLHGGLEGLWKTLESELDRRNLTAWLACGHTPKAARLLARTRQGQCTDDRQALKQSLRSIPVEHAELDPKATERLQRMGLQSLGRIFQLPDRELARRLGPETCLGLQKLVGTAADPQKEWSPPAHFHRRLDFAEDVEHTSGLLFPLQRALQELEEELRWRQHSTDTLEIQLHHRVESATDLPLRSTAPEHRASAFLALLRLKLERLELISPVIGATLQVQRFISRHTPAGDDLFGESDSGRDEAWQHLLSRLQTRLGDGALRALSVQDDHRPEQACQYQAIDTAKTGAAMIRHALPRRPLWFLKAPQPLVHMPLEWLAGPERISAGWWDGERIQRDYYIARLHSGQTGWLFRDVTGGWFIHGWFG
ncbi:MAG: DNA repair protein [Alteromonadaceae bacterium]|nr:DNA repair protein [Alteromonadaceae bacterium]MBH86058.1 DNA repair protein [Alteromonadaceae bacterium]